MAEVKWIKITTDIFDDEKIILIEALPDAYAIITVWFKLLCFAGKQNNSGVFMMNNRIAYTDKMLSTIFRMKESTVQLALKVFDDFGMIELVDGVITIPNWGKHQSLDKLEERKEYMRKYMQEYREKQKSLTDVNSVNVNGKYNGKANVNSLEEDRDKDIEEDKEKNSAEPSEIKDFFESIWREYPEKKGKSQISMTTKRKLHKVGEETLLRAIDNYKDDLRINDWKKPMNGSTFFNGRYEDYLQVEEKPEIQFLNIGDDDDAL